MYTIVERDHRQTENRTPKKEGREKRGLSYPIQRQTQKAEAEKEKKTFVALALLTHSDLSARHQGHNNCFCSI
jgi:hypothetical protein